MLHRLQHQVLHQNYAMSGQALQQTTQTLRVDNDRLQGLLEEHGSQLQQLRQELANAGAVVTLSSTQTTTQTDDPPFSGQAATQTDDLPAQAEERSEAEETQSAHGDSLQRRQHHLRSSLAWAIGVTLSGDEDMDALDFDLVDALNEHLILLHTSTEELRQCHQADLQSLQEAQDERAVCLETLFQDLHAALVEDDVGKALQDRFQQLLQIDELTPDHERWAKDLARPIATWLLHQPVAAAAHQSEEILSDAMQQTEARAQLRAFEDAVFAALQHYQRHGCIEAMEVTSVALLSTEQRVVLETLRQVMDDVPQTIAEGIQPFEHRATTLELQLAALQLRAVQLETELQDQQSQTDSAAMRAEAAEKREGDEREKHRTLETSWNTTLQQKQEEAHQCLESLSLMRDVLQDVQTQKSQLEQQLLHVQAAVGRTKTEALASTAQLGDVRLALTRCEERHRQDQQAFNTEAEVSALL